MNRYVEKEVGKSGVARAVKWSYAGTGLSLGLQLLLSAVLARHLDPAAYGLTAVAGTVLGYAGYFTELGVVSTILQRRELRAVEDIGLLSVLAVGTNILLAGLIWVLAPWLIARVGGGPPAVEGVEVLRLMALSPVLMALGQTAGALLRRNLDFRRVAILSIVALAIGQGLVALPLALAGWGAWSLVWGGVAQAGVTSALALFWVRPALWPAHLDRDSWRLLGCGVQFSALRLLDASSLYLPSLAVAMLAGFEEAGLFNRAYIFGFLPLEVLVTSLSKVLFPAFSRLDGKALAESFQENFAAAACLILPIGAGMAVAAPEIVAVMLGGLWSRAAPVLAWMAGWSALRVLAHLCGMVCEAQGRLRERGAIQALCLAAAVAGLALWRPDTAVKVLGLAMLAETGNLLMLLSLTGRTLNHSPGRLAAGLLPAVPVIGAVGAGLFLLLEVMRPGVPPLPRLVAAVVAGACLLIAALVVQPSGRRLIRRLTGMPSGKAD